MKTAEERVRKGIAWLDRQYNLKGWRNKLNPDTMQFANPGQGSIGTIIRRLCIGVENFENHRWSWGDPAELKQAWKEALKTDERWTNYKNVYTSRTIKGIRYTISKTFEGTFRIESLKCKKYGYSSYDSAKRAVRKLSKEF